MLDRPVEGLFDERIATAEVVGDQRVVDARRFGHSPKR
jgi:hypothetical protein